MKFTHNEIYFDVTYEGNLKWSKRYFMNIWSVLMSIIHDDKITLIMCEHHCVKLFFVDLFTGLAV